MEKTTGEINDYTVRWYVVCTATKAEEIVNKQLEQSCFETYLPLQPVNRVWNDQKRKIMIPLIPRIVFVCLSKDDIKQTPTLKGGSFLLQEDEKYVSVSIEQMEVFRKAMQQTSKSMTFLPENTSSSIVNRLSLDSVEEVKQVLSIEGIGTVLMIG